MVVFFAFAFVELALFSAFSRFEVTAAAVIVAAEGPGRAEIEQESNVRRTADGQQYTCGQACAAPPSESRAARRSRIGCGALGAAVRGA